MRCANHQANPAGPCVQNRYSCQALQHGGVPERVRDALKHHECFCIPDGLSHCMREDMG